MRNFRKSLRKRKNTIARRGGSGTKSWGTSSGTGTSTGSSHPGMNSSLPTSREGSSSYWTPPGGHQAHQAAQRAQLDAQLDAQREAAKKKKGAEHAVAMVAEEENTKKAENIRL